MIEIPSHVEAGTISLKIYRPHKTLTKAKNATYTPSNFEKSHFTELTTNP